MKTDPTHWAVMGSAEVAEYMGVTVQAVSNWLKRDKIIKPIARLRMGPIWSTPSIIEWAFEYELQVTNRKRGDNGRYVA